MTTVDAPNRRGRRIAIWTIVAVFAVLIGGIVWVGIRGWLAASELTAAVPLAAEIQGSIADSDGESARSTAVELADRAASAAELTGDPVWRVAEFIPWVGENMAAVRVMSDVLDDVAEGAIVPLVGIADEVDAAALESEGRLDPAPLIAIRPVVSDARAIVDDGLLRVGEIDSGGLVEPVADASSQFLTALVEASQLTAAVDDAVQILPGMLGADGPRTYLVLFQNNAELRTGGGIPGALALVQVDDGKVSLVDQAASTDIVVSDEPVLPLPQTDVDLFGTELGRYMQNVTATPDFSLSSRLAATMWARDRGVDVDGVIAVDPVGLGYLLGATGPVTLATGDQLTEENAVQSLLIDAYARFPRNADQDAYFAAAAASVFEAISAGTPDPAKLVSAVTRMVDDHRLAIWSAHENEQSVLETTTLGGMQAVQNALGDQAYAVYLNDRTGGKMGAYLDVDATAEVVDVRDDGRSEVAVSVTLTNTAPADAAVTLPERVTNAARLGADAGLIALNLTAVSPPAAFDGGITRDDAAINYETIEVGDRLANSVAVDLAPGESTTIVYRFISAEQGQDEPVVFTTPLISH